MLTLKDVEAMIADKSSQGQQSQSGKWFDGTEWRRGSVPTGQASGSFRGKSGSIRRSAKGRTRRMPNGSRKYLIDYDTTVVAYLPSK